jgi:tRNA(Ile)-lysidine synthase
MLQADLEYLDDAAESLLAEHSPPGSRAAGTPSQPGDDTADGLEVSWLAGLHESLRLRVLRLAALRAGSPASELFRVHVLELDRLVTDYRGQQWVDLPGHMRAAREEGRLRFQRTPRHRSH